MSRVLGIDPGVSGAIVLLEDGRPIEWLLMPVLKVGKSSRVDAAALGRFVGAAGAAHAYLEQVGSMPGQGVASMFTFGHAAGCVAGVLGALQVPVTLIPPQRWKKAAGLIGTDKDAARSRAIQLWPAWAELAKKGSGQALADAALIARFGNSTGVENG